MKTRKMSKTTKIIAAVGVVLILAIGFGMLITFNESLGLPDWVNKPIVSFKQTVGLDEPDGASDSEKPVVEESYTDPLVTEDGQRVEIYYPADKDIVLDEYGHPTFVNNLIIVKVVAEATDADVQQIAKDIDGEIVAVNDLNKSYTIKLSKKYSIDKIGELSKSVESKYDFVRLARYELFSAVDVPKNSYYPNDKEWNPKMSKETWDSSASADGKNWGAEIIDAPQLWAYKDQMKYTRLGILDGAFSEHSDYIFSELYFNDPKYGSAYHGTHVAGIAAAVFDNNHGIAGIAPMVELYGVSSEGLSRRPQKESIHKITVSNLEAGLAMLIGANDCKVINYSMGLGATRKFLLSKGDAEAVKDLETNRDSVCSDLKYYLENGKDFVIVQAAGNENNPQWSYFVNKDGNYELDRTGQKGESPNGSIADWDYLSAIEDQEVRDRIIVVGNLDRNKQVSLNSNHGSRVDILAPGDDIYSTYPNNKYERLSGTSMAAPHVSGVAASLFGLDGTLTGAEVKKIIIETATGSYGYASPMFTDRYPLLNAGNAAREVVDNHELIDVLYMNDNESARKIWATDSDASSQSQGILQVGLSFSSDSSGRIILRYLTSQNHYLSLVSRDEINIDRNGNFSLYFEPENSYGAQFRGKLNFRIGKADDGYYYLEANPFYYGKESPDKTPKKFRRTVDPIVSSNKDIVDVLEKYANEELKGSFEILDVAKILGSPHTLDNEYGNIYVYVPGGIGGYDVWIVTRYGLATPFPGFKESYDRGQGMVGPNIF